MLWLEWVHCTRWFSWYGVAYRTNNLIFIKSPFASLLTLHFSLSCSAQLRNSRFIGVLRGINLWNVLVFHRFLPERSLISKRTLNRSLFYKCLKCDFYWTLCALTCIMNMIGICWVFHLQWVVNPRFSRCQLFDSSFKLHCLLSLNLLFTCEFLLDLSLLCPFYLSLLKTPFTKLFFFLFLLLFFPRFLLLKLLISRAPPVNFFFQVISLFGCFSEHNIKVKQFKEERREVRLRCSVPKVFNCHFVIRL